MSSKTGFAVVDVPMEGVTVLLSFGESGDNGFDKSFDLLGETYIVPYVRRGDTGQVMIDLCEQIGHGIPMEKLEELGCTVTLRDGSAHSEGKVTASLPSPGGNKGRSYYFA